MDDTLWVLQWAGNWKSGLGKAAHIKHQKERKFYTTIAKRAHAIELKRALGLGGCGRAWGDRTRDLTGINYDRAEGRTTSYGASASNGTQTVRTALAYVHIRLADGMGPVQCQGRCVLLAKFNWPANSANLQSQGLATTDTVAQQSGCTVWMWV